MNKTNKYPPPSAALIRELQDLAPAAPGKRTKPGSIAAAAAYYGVEQRTWQKYRSGESSPPLATYLAWREQAGLPGVEVSLNKKK